MRIFIYLTLATLFSWPTTASAQQKAPDWLFNWINAWELINKDLLKQPPVEPPAMLFYDNEYVYTNSVVSAPNGTSIDGPAIYGKNIQWRKATHADSIMLPNGQTVPVQLMSFAGPVGNGGTFFVMAAPAFWENAGVKSTLFNLDMMLTGVFLHEFAHCRQYEGFGRLIDSIEQKHAFKTVPLNDDIVQGYFKSDSAYVKYFRTETEMFYSSILPPKKNMGKKFVEMGLGMIESRQRKYFTGDTAILQPLDNIFLSMEGLGQYVAVSWLCHKQGGNLPLATAVEGFRRKRNQWSQEEGLSIFLALGRFAKPGWINKQFGTNPTDVIQLLKEVVGK
ncbi:hypothetical protein HHL16_17285 [Pseudoflavitalea sp. G-6-1-2]|uniref:hypothetical protein n=1 Tax=Pseudoflavitalea sp. G-6-1-2 TaxID=2728841 RepID=UPI00146E9B23|nr:hypothetical protein [Pseudoflavitalea sp. G-6-1-2]NML22640.1 hypothetical protein [Pseudoflavitalea sp. G-6-1-2]